MKFIMCNIVKSSEESGRFSGAPLESIRASRLKAKSMHWFCQKLFKERFLGVFARDMKSNFWNSYDCHLNTCPLGLHFIEFLARYAGHLSSSIPSLPEPFSFNKLEGSWRSFKWNDLIHVTHLVSYTNHRPFVQNVHKFEQSDFWVEYLFGRAPLIKLCGV